MLLLKDEITYVAQIMGLLQSGGLDTIYVISSCENEFLFKVNSVRVLVQIGILVVGVGSSERDVREMLLV